LQILYTGYRVASITIYIAYNGIWITRVNIINNYIKIARENIAQSGLPASQVMVQKMDYYYLKSILGAFYAGVYIIETFVHATDPKGVLANFYWVLHHGGRVALFEYNYIFKNNLVPEDVARSMEQVNIYAAMPTNIWSTLGQYKQWLEKAGF
jgi:sterol 24-C-methyltransferase